jgi:hypothetical protein
MSFYRYLPERDVHALDCGGPVDLQTGIERLHTLRRELEGRPPKGGVAKLLIDFRETVWADASVHMELSRLTRTEFGLNPGNTALRAAILHTERSGAVADNERWFAEEEEALRWLGE